LAWQIWVFFGRNDKQKVMVAFLFSAVPPKTKKIAKNFRQTKDDRFFVQALKKAKARRYNNIMGMHTLNKPIKQFLFCICNILFRKTVPCFAKSVAIGGLAKYFWSKSIFKVVKWTYALTGRLCTSKKIILKPIQKKWDFKPQSTFRYSYIPI